MVRRLPWTHPDLKVAYTTPRRNTPASESTSNMASRTPRGRKLVYNKSGSSAKSSWRNRSTPGGGGGFGSTPSSQKQRLDGLFLEGNWYCNCEPRGLASYLRVAKNTKNKGRFFYTCPKGRKGGCDFFLWSEDAENRAGSGSNTMKLPPMPDETLGGGAAEETTPMKPPLGATSSLPTPSMTAPATRQRSMGEFVSTQKPVETTPSRTAAKRKRVLFEFDDDEDEDELFGNVSSDEERQMFEVMQSSAKKLGPPAAAAAAAAAAAPATPSTRRTEHVETPATVSRTLFPEAKRRKPDDGAVSFGSTSTTSSGTAVPYSSSPPSPGGTPGEEQLDPTAEVLDLLRTHKVEDAAALRDVRAVLQKFSLKAKGVARGRDSVRTALKKKDERIADLQERVASLENRNRVQKEQIEDFKAGIMDLYSKH